jgi:hypothetical protein
MTTLENELIKSILDDMSKGTNTITPSDVKIFFDKSQDKVQRLINTKELCLQNAKKRLVRYVAWKNDKELIDPGNVIKNILEDLKDRLTVALMDFQDRKRTKHDGLVKQLKLAAISGKPSSVLKCLYDIQTLNNTFKDLRIVDLQDQILKYSNMPHAEGARYLNFYSQQEEQENTKVEIATLSNEIAALTLILENRE